MIVPPVPIRLHVIVAAALTAISAASPALAQVDFTNGIPDGFTFGPGAVNVLVDPTDPRSSQPTANVVPRVGSNFTTSSGLTVQNGGIVGGGLDALAGSLVTVNAGGVIQSAPGTVFLGTDTDFTTLGTVVVNGGSIGSGFDIGSNSRVTVNGGSLGASAQAFPGSEVNINGGSIGSGFAALATSEVNFSGGFIFPGFTTSGTLNQTGGGFGAGARALNGSTINLNPGASLGA